MTKLLPLQAMEALLTWKQDGDRHQLTKPSSKAETYDGGELDGLSDECLHLVAVAAGGGVPDEEVSPLVFSGLLNGAELGEVELLGLRQLLELLSEGSNVGGIFVFIEIVKGWNCDGDSIGGATTTPPWNRGGGCGGRGRWRRRGTCLK